MSMYQALQFEAKVYYQHCKVHSANSKVLLIPAKSKRHYMRHIFRSQKFLIKLYILVLFGLFFKGNLFANEDLDVTIGQCNAVKGAVPYYFTLNCGSAENDGCAEKRKLVVAVGSKDGTYHNLAANLKEVLRPDCIDLEFSNLPGSVTINSDVFDKGGIQLGMVQQDIYVADEDSIQKRDWINIVVPLHYEQVHVLAKKEFDTIQDLKGKNVYLGQEGSGTRVTAQRFFGKYFCFDKDCEDENKKTGELFANLTIDDAVRELLGTNSDQAISSSTESDSENLELDAVVYVAGQPAKVFQEKNINSAKFHFLPVKSEEGELYKKAIIKKSEYEWMDIDVDTVQVRSYLITYDWNKKRTKYYKSNCAAVDEVQKRIDSSLDELKEISSKGFAHPRWLDIKILKNVVFPLERFNCEHR